MIAVWVMSSMPDNAVVELPNSQWDSMIKESLHLVEFAILYIFFVLALLTIRGLTLKLNLICVLIASLYGLTDEIHQSFVPARSATLIDLIKDVTGVLIASWIMYSAYSRKRFQGIGRLLHQLEDRSGKNPSG
nr:VanZ family protein [uncultured Bacillus sp.]